jgi:hypothetical protein
LQVDERTATDLLEDLEGFVLNEYETLNFKQDITPEEAERLDDLADVRKLLDVAGRLL